MDDIATPHDAFFRETFSRREIAQDFLRQQLPAPLLAVIDLGTLEISKDTYVSEDLRSAYSDLVYRVRYGNGTLTIYLLFEHKSSPEHWTLLRYYVQGTGRVDEQDARLLLQQKTSTGDPIMQTFIDRYIEQGRQQGMEVGEKRGEAKVLLRQISRKFGTPSDSVLERISNADPDSLLRWSERILTADSLDAVLH